MDKKKLDKLNKYIKELKQVVVCYSGGKDSFLLLHICTEILGFKNTVGIFCDSDFVVEKDREGIAKTYAKYNVKIIKVNPYLEQICNNDAARCAYCKENSLKEIIQMTHSIGFTNIIDGANCTDLLDYRPGLKVSNDLHILHPYIECDINKYDIIEMLDIYKLSSFNKPSNSCYASRVMKGTLITPSIISKVCECERIVAKFGFKSFRVRVSDDTLRLELDKQELKTLKMEVLLKVHDALRDKFKYITLDLGGYKLSGLELE